MKKLLTLLSFFAFFGGSAYSQGNGTLEERTAKANEEFKTALISKLGHSTTVAENIMAIEAEFNKNIAAINLQQGLTIKQREERLHPVHVARITKLLAIPLTNRQMEDVIDADRVVRGKYKL